MANSNRPSALVRLAWITIVLTYLLMAAGAFVRVSGAGMGCPDWPRCFGLLIPPTSLADLPPLGSYTYPPGWKVESFDPLMTWIEFINRLLGALVGIAILATVVQAWRHHRRQPAVWELSLVALVGALYAAWLGGRVVAHELAPWIVTVHLMVAVLVLMALFGAVHAVGDVARASRGWVSLLALLSVLVQGAVGTQVRGLIEDVARAQPSLARAEWLQQVGTMDIIHRNLALVPLMLVMMTLLSARSDDRSDGGARTRPAWVAMAAVMAQMVLGTLLAYAALPRSAQVLHLLVATVLIGALTLVWLRSAWPPKSAMLSP